MRRIKFLFFIIALCSVSLSYADNLTPTENHIKSNIANANGEAVDLLKKLVNINSGTLNISGINKVGEILREQFEQLGFKTYWVKEPDHFKRAGTLGNPPPFHGNHSYLPQKRVT
jgi:glutamate carboxypeptidase